MNRLFFLFAAAFLAAVVAQDGDLDSSVLHCRYCNSAPKGDCELKPLEALEISCLQLNYAENDARSSGGSPRQNKHLLSVFKRESSRGLVIDENTEFKCIAASIVDDGEAQFVRSCAPVQKNIANECDFMSQHMEVKSCFECSDNLCNSAVLATSSVFLSLSSLLFAWFLIKL